MTGDKELCRLKKKVDRLIEKCDENGVEFSNIEIGTISRIGHAKIMEELDCSVLHSIDSIFNRYKI
ncbi:hypothetical protein [Bacillus inaquosorum]|uniref:hypothetical protein n=1 Tax=Bacillus inaquosorum TaxID=483913 RepID=UPI00227D9DD7|nr:hypothetical protein [Bacillus inaquosorum]MCY7902078.1 hypothetical protein [Bacillus inaquosorum]MCY8261556.1 hypothetical protein [Bacillus inaquosorum]